MAIDWEAIACTELHPLRVACLRAIDASSSPKSPAELSLSFDEPLSNVSYHVKALAMSGLIVLDHTRPKRGALEHFYAMPGAA